MKHEISVLGCGVIYIDNERVFGSKPYGLFSTVNWSATDEDLKRIADRCLELIADRTDETKTQIKTQNSNLTFEKADEPQADCYKCADFWNCDGQCDEVEDEPQTDCAWK